MKKAIDVLVIAGGIALLLSGCAPETLTTSAACRVYEDMYVNSPGLLSKEAAAHQVGYYRDLEKRTDGMLREAFAEQREWAERVLVSDPDITDSEAAPLHDLSAKANKVIWNICGYPS